MRINEQQLKDHAENGFLFLQEYFSLSEIEALRAQLPATFAEDGPRRVVEKEGNTVRSVYGSHSTNEVFRCLTRHPRLVHPAEQILASKVYVYQFKINVKAAFTGDVWEWHQDYVFWRKEDGLATPRVINAVVFLHEVNDFNGPLFIIPGSHKEGTIDVPARDTLSDGENNLMKAYSNEPRWISNLTAKLKYSLDREVVATLAAKRGIVAPKGPAGSVLFFDGNIIHGSPNNISPFDRVLIFITFNSVENIPHPVENPRPDFLVSRDHSPIIALSDDVLLQ